jgi:predicted choloylglycine hydrolase
MSAMNDAGLCMATNEIYSAGDGSTRFEPDGQPMFGTFRRLMEECATVADAEKLVSSIKHTTMSSLTVCDAKSGAVFELTPKNVGVRRADKGLCFCTNHFLCKGLAVKEDCWRLKELEKSRERRMWTLADLAKQMDAVNQGACTMQSMVFEPATLTMHIALGKPPTSGLPLKKLELGPYLKKK